MKMIKLFDDVRRENIELKVNQFMNMICHQEQAEVVDIRYNTYVNEHGHDTWTVMVIYEE